MNVVIKTYQDYDTKAYGTPWAAPCDRTGRPQFKGKVGHYTGGRGKAGDLFVEDPEEGSVWAYGQKCYKGTNEKAFVVYRGERFCPVEPTDLLAALATYHGEPVEEDPTQLPTIKGVIRNGPRSNRHLSFTPEEDAEIRKRANRVGMEVNPYIKYIALNGSVKGYRLTPLQKHEQAIGEIVRAAKEMAYRPHPDRWLYEKDLEGIDNKLGEILAIEKDILDLLRRRMK